MIDTSIRDECLESLKAQLHHIAGLLDQLGNDSLPTAAYVIGCAAEAMRALKPLPTTTDIHTRNHPQSARRPRHWPSSAGSRGIWRCP